MTVRSVEEHGSPTGDLDWRNRSTSEDRLVSMEPLAHPCSNCGYTEEPENPLTRRGRFVRVAQATAIVLTSTLICMLAIIGGVVVTFMGIVVWG